MSTKARQLVDQLLEFAPVDWTKVFRLEVAIRDHREEEYPADYIERAMKAVGPNARSFEFGNVLVDEYIMVFTDYPGEDLDEMLKDTDYGHRLALIEETPITFRNLDELKLKIDKAAETDY